jgi:RimJ/RimL family protein N-acetyltransferase
MKPTDLKTPGAFIRRFTTKNSQAGIIRVLALSDLDLLLGYVNNLISEDTYVAVSGKPISRRSEAAYLNKAVIDIQKGRKIHFVAESKGRLAGSFEIRIREKRSKHVGEIGIALAPEFRGSGLGTIALQALIEAAEIANLRLLTLTCFTVNIKAIGLYKKMGFHKAGEIPGVFAYRGGYENEMIMYKCLGKETYDCRKLGRYQGSFVK